MKEPRRCEGPGVGGVRFIVRVLTGPHEGAEMEIPEGGLIIGSGGECDLSLFDPRVVPKHAWLAPVGHGVVLRPLQGAVWLDMVSVKDDVELLDGAKQIITVGDTHLAVGSPRCSSEEKWPPTHGFSGGGLSSGKQGNPNVARKALPIGKGKKSTDALLFITAAVAGTLLAFTILGVSRHLGKEKGMGTREMDRLDLLGKVVPPKKSELGNSGLAVVPRLSAPESIDPSLFPLEAKAATQLSRDMNEGVVCSLDVQGGKSQLRIWVRGGTESAVARGIASRFSPPLHYQVFDLAQLEASAAMLAQLSGLSLRVCIAPGGIAFWSGYLQNDRMWHEFLPRVARELPIIRNHCCRIIFGNRLAKTLQAELRQRGLRQVQPVASENSVLLAGSLPKEQQGQWNAWMTKVRERYVSWIPIIDRVNSSAVVRVASKDFFPSRIVGVSGTTGPWVALSDGSKFFQGARLRDGYILKEITPSMLLLNSPEGALRLPVSGLD
ncbi:MAG: hypothetical protein JMM79_02955 [Candidatus Xiphinematobacter sp.]|nr:MAG: hypothetical protein JMM79_02955 [Candidatus Xiphinematobacter sp.]